MAKTKSEEVIVKITAEQLDAHGYHIFLNTKLNGKTCRFLIDTGASHSVIDKKYFEKNIGPKNLKTNKQSTTGLHSSNTESYFGKIKEWKIGPLVVKNYTIAAVDLGHVNLTYASVGKKKIQGILGSDILFKHKMEIDYGKQQLRF